MSAEQAEIPGFEQEKVPAIERAADKYDEKRKIWQGVGDELTTLKAKLSEVVHQHADLVDRGEDEKHHKVLIYKRGDYSVTITEGSEKLKCTIGGEEPAEPEL
jgi:hypothetical protein